MKCKSSLSFYDLHPDSYFPSVLNAGKQGKIGTYIIFPTGLYGASTGPVKALGVIQLLMYLKAKELGFVPYIGDGTARFNTVSYLIPLTKLP